MSGRPVGASALLLVLRHSCWCFGTLDWCFGTPVGASALLIGASTLLLVLWHSFWCFNTLVGASTLLIGASALLLVLWHSCCVSRHVQYGATVPQYCIVPLGTYCTASYSFLMIGLVVKQLYNKTLNKE